MAAVVLELPVSVFYYVLYDFILYHVNEYLLLYLKGLNVRDREIVNLLMSAGELSKFKFK